MDVDTSEAIGRLGDRIDALEVSLRTEIRDGLAESRAEFRDGLAESRTEFREDLAKSRSELRAEFREDLAESRTEFRQGFAELRTEIREGLAESRRHADVLFERLRDEIRILAEGLSVLSAKLESLRR